MWKKIWQKIKKWKEIICDGISNFSFRPKTPITDITGYPFKEPPIMLVVYHPDIAMQKFQNGDDASYTGHVLMRYDGLCIDSQVQGQAANGQLQSTNTSTPETVFGRIRRKKINPPYVYMLFPSQLGLKPEELKKRMAEEIKKINDYNLFENNCVHHAFRALLGIKEARKEFGDFFTPREALQWCDKACARGGGIRVDGKDMVQYLDILGRLYDANKEETKETVNFNANVKPLNKPNPINLFRKKTAQRS